MCVCVCIHTCVHICICSNMHITIYQWIFIEENDVSAYENYLEIQRTLKTRSIHCASELHWSLPITDHSQFKATAGSRTVFHGDYMPMGESQRRH